MAKGNDSTSRHCMLEWLGMTRWTSSEIGAVLAWVVGSLLLAAVLVPWVYQAGMGLVAACEVGHFGRVIEGLGASCGRAGYGRYFDRTLLASALALLPVLLWRIRDLQRRAGDLREVPRINKLSMSAGWRQCLLGMLVGSCVLWGLGLLAVWAGAFEFKEVPTMSRVLNRVLVPTLMTPLVEEWLFRGILLGLWLRFTRPLTAGVGCSLVFALLHFLELPAHAAISHPEAAWAGFELLGKILLNFADPTFLIADFTTLFGVGCVLAWARIRTGALWLPIGLHAGWILAFKGFNLCYAGVNPHFLRPWGIGPSLRSGVLPLLALGVTLLLVRAILEMRAARMEPEAISDLP